MIQITAIPAFQDNYHWLLESPSECWVVDPGDPDVIRSFLEKKGRDLTGILVTHHHWDHIGGIPKLASDNTQVIGPALSRYELVNDPVSDGDRRTICGHEFQILEVPGHTLNHIAYFAKPDDQAPLLFCGDTLFAGGCGRLFEGTPAQMNNSFDKLAALPNETLIYCAHEYTLSNLEFAIDVEPHNQALIERIEETTKIREANIPTIPSTLQLEKKTNPFMRVSEQAVIARARLEQPEITTSPAEVFGVIRKLKDNF